MSGILELVRRVVEQELARRRAPMLGVVSAVFPHTAEDDEHNYEVNVRLKHEDLELRGVPVAVAHVGVAAPPRPGDLVLLHFLDGDLNQPVIAGRFYHADERPPLHQEEEVLFEQRVSDGTLNHLRFTADGSIYLQRDVTKPEDNSEAKTSVRIDGASGDVEVKVGSDITLLLSGDTVTIMGKVDITGDVQINGDLTVSDGATRTTISGNTVEGG
jgi:phage baseplate assembly protein gpV